MPQFQYKARDAKGKLISGTMEGSSTTDIQRRLSLDGMYPLEVSQAQAGLSLELPNFLQRKPKPKDIANMTRQFQVMFDVGIPVNKILGILSEQVIHKGLKQALTNIGQDVATGTPLSDAFEKYPQYFSELYTSMLRVGEKGGVLGRALLELASSLQKQHDLRSKIKSAMLYPKIVIGALVGVGWLMLAFVFPPFKAFYEDKGAELPMLTKMMIVLSDLVTVYWYVPVISIVAAAIGWKYAQKLEGVKLFLSLVAFKLPVFGKLNLIAANSHFGHLIASLYKAGLPLATALGVVATTITNQLYSKEVDSLRIALEKGQSLSQGMAGCKYFEPMVRESCAIGEQTGRLDVILKATTSFYDNEIDDMLKNLTTLIEPILLFFLFGAVLVLALAVYLPIWNLSDVVLSNG